MREPPALCPCSTTGLLSFLLYFPLLQRHYGISISLVSKERKCTCIAKVIVASHLCLPTLVSASITV